MKDYDTKKIFLINYKAVYGETWDNYGTKFSIREGGRTVGAGSVSEIIE